MDQTLPLLYWLNPEPKIAHKHHGFVSGRSCLTNLLETFENWTEFLDEGYGVDVIYSDYRKAFDTIPKVRQAGIGGKVLNLIRAFIRDTEMTVTVTS